MSILLFPVSAFADSDEFKFTDFDPRFTKLAESSASQWYSSSDNRALLTALIIIDLVLALPSGTPDLPNATKTSYVGKDESVVNIFLQTDNDTMIAVIYMPEADRAGYGIINNSGSDALTELYASAICHDGYEKNDTS